MNIPLGEIPNEKRGTAIHMASSGAHIEGNEFEGFLRGIYIDNDMGLTTRQAQIINNTFTDIYRGIDGLSDINTVILDNTLINTASWRITGATTSLTAQRRGIYLNSSGLTKVMGNYIHYPFSATTGASEYTYGLVANYTKSYYNIYIGSNVFKDHTNHVHAQNDNKGLASYCNLFDGQYGAAISYVPAWIEHSLGDHGTGCDLIVEYRSNNRFINRRPGSYQLRYDNYAMGSTLPQPFHYYALNVPEERIDYVLDPAGSIVDYENCTSPFDDEDPHKLCEYVAIPVHLSSSTELSGLVTEFTRLKNNNLRFGAQAEYLYAEILRGYHHLYPHSSAPLITFLEGDATTGSGLLLVPLYIEAGDYQAAISRLSSLSLPQNQKTALMDYYSVVISLMSSGQWHSLSLTPLQVQTLTGIAADAELIARPYAVSTLHRAGLISDISDYFPIFTSGYGNNSSQNHMKEWEEGKEDALSVYPNPSEDIFTIEYPQPESGSEDSQLAVYTVTGRLVYSDRVDSGRKTSSLSARRLNMGSGVYYIVYRAADGDVQYGKIIISR